MFFDHIPAEQLKQPPFPSMVLPTKVQASNEATVKTRILAGNQPDIEVRRQADSPAAAVRPDQGWRNQDEKEWQRLAAKAVDLKLSATEQSAFDALTQKRRKHKHPRPSAEIIADYEMRSRAERLLEILEANAEPLPKSA